MNANVLKEAHNISIVEATDLRGSKWEVVLIEACCSKNDNNYSSKLLRNSLHLFKDLKARAYQFGKSFTGQAQFDHLPVEMSESGDSLVGNTVGFYDNIRYGKFTRPDGTAGEGILGTLNILEGAEWLMKNLKGLWEAKKIKLLGLSIDAKGSSEEKYINGKRVQDVKTLETVASTDVVDHPAAGGGFLRMVASTGANPMEKLLEALEQHRSSWFDGFAKPEKDSDLKDYALRVLESNLVKAQEAQDETPIDEVKNLSGIARGVKTLRDIIAMLRNDNKEGAIKMLMSMINAMTESSAKAKGISTYSYPYTAPQAREVEVTVKQESGNNSMENETKDLTKPVEEEVDSQMAKREADLACKEAELKVKSALLESGLPEAAQDRIKELFVGKSEITDEQLTEAIQKEKDYIASFSESGKPNDLGDAHDDDVDETKVAMKQESRDKMDKALDGMWAGKDIDGVRRFSGVKEAFAVFNQGKAPAGWHSPRKMARLILEAVHIGMPKWADLDGDDDYGISDPLDTHRGRLKESWGQIGSRQLREAVVTSDFSIAFGDSMFRRLQREYSMDPNSDWRQIISSIENLTDATNTFNVPRIGSTGAELPIVNENAPYQELTDPTEENTTLTPDKFGALFKYTWEDVLADRLGVLRQIPRKIARTSNRTVWKKVWDLIEENSVITSTGVALISTATHVNQVDSDPALSFDEVVNAVQLLREQTEQDTTERLGLDPKFLLVSVANESLAHEITGSEVKVTSAEDATISNTVSNRWKMQPFVTNGIGRTVGKENRWYVTIDPKMGETISVGFLGGRDRPELFVQGANTPTQGSFFDADAITFKSRYVFGVAAVDFRWIVGSLKA